MRPSTLWTRGRDFLRSYWTPAGKQALGNLIGLIACTGVSQGCAFGVLLLLTHGLPQEGFGAVIFALNLQSYLVAVGTFGLTTIVVRDLAQHPDRRAETITAYLTIVTVASVLVGVVTAVVAAVVPISTDERVMLWCVAAGNVAACLNLNPLFDAAHKQALAAALAVPADLLTLGAVAGLYLTHSLTVPLVGFILLGKWALVALMHAAIYFRGARRLRPVWLREWGEMTKHLRAGWPNLATLLLYLVPLQGGVLVARWGEGERGAAIYGLAVQAALTYMMLAWLGTRVLYPHINGPYGFTRTFVIKLIVVGTLGAGGLWAAGILAGWVLTHYILNVEYITAYPVIVLLLTAASLTPIVMITNAYLTRIGRQGLIVWIYAASDVAYVATLSLIGPTPTHHCGIAVVVSTGVLAVASVATTWRFCRHPTESRGAANVPSTAG